MKNLWWGYLHTSGTIQAKRYFSPLDLLEAVESPFAQSIHTPFEAEDREEALKILNEHFAIPELGNNAEPIRNISEDDWRKDDR